MCGLNRMLQHDKANITSLWGNMNLQFGNFTGHHNNWTWPSHTYPHGSA